MKVKRYHVVEVQAQGVSILFTFSELRLAEKCIEELKEDLSKRDFQITESFVNVQD